MTDKTKIVWDGEYEEYKCEKCGAYFVYNFDFRYCPYCRREIDNTEQRWPVTKRIEYTGVIRR